MNTTELFRLHATFVARFLMRIGTHSQDVEDLVQEVFVISHRHGGYVAGPAKPTTWLARIALGVASSHRRTRKRHPEHLTDDAATYGSAQGSSPADTAENAQALARVQQALDQMDMDRRFVFVLFELEGESCEQIAASLGIPIGTVHSRLHTARKEFTEAMDRIRAADDRQRMPLKGVAT